MFDGWLSNLFSSGSGVAGNLATTGIQNSTNLLGNGIANTGFLSGMSNVSDFLPQATNVASDGILSSMSNIGGNVMDFLKNESTAKLLGAGSNAFGAFNQYNQAKDAKKIMNEQMNMAKDAYNYDRANAERTARLVF